MGFPARGRGKQEEAKVDFSKITSSWNFIEFRLCFRSERAAGNRKLTVPKSPFQVPFWLRGARLRRFQELSLGIPCRIRPFWITFKWHPSTLFFFRQWLMTLKGKISKGVNFSPVWFCEKLWSRLIIQAKFEDFDLKFHFRICEFNLAKFISGREWNFLWLLNGSTKC